MQYQNLKNSNLIIFLLICLPMIAFGQKEVSSFDESFDWNKTNTTKTILVKVAPEADEVKMDFEGSITRGALLISAYDPDGNKVGGFSLVCSGAEGGNVNVNTSESGNTTIHIDSDSGSGSNFTFDSDSDSHYHYDSDSGTSTTKSTTNGTNSTVTVTTSTGKAKGKNKSKSKTKTKRRSKNVDGKNYSVVTTTSDSKGAKGVMKKRFDDPAAGVWKFVLEVKEVSGTLTAKVDQK